MPGRTRFSLGIFIFPVSVVMLYLGPSLAVDATTPTVRVIATLCFILIGTFAFLVAFGLWFVSGSNTLNRATGELIEELRILGSPQGARIPPSGPLSPSKSADMG